MILVTKFQLWIGILIFWTKFPQKGLFRSKTKKVNNTIEFCIFKLVYYTTILRPIALPPLAPPSYPLIINVIFIGTGFGDATLSQHTATLSSVGRGEGGRSCWVVGGCWFISAKWWNFHSKISKIFSRDWLGLSNLCEILPQNLRKLGKSNWWLLGFPVIFKNHLGHI